MGGLILVSVYQSSWGADKVKLERCIRGMESQVSMVGERLMIGEDFNASVERDAERRRVCGKH